MLFVAIWLGFILVIFNLFYCREEKIKITIFVIFSLSKDTTISKIVFWNNNKTNKLLAYQLGTIFRSREREKNKENNK